MRGGEAFSPGFGAQPDGATGPKWWIGGYTLVSCKTHAANLVVGELIEPEDVRGGLSNSAGAAVHRVPHNRVPHNRVPHAC